ncbi:hypothetical protein [Euzebya sp.]|uniref:hypothetical protein n=1 Tax=Euzebya sp. TaxID=1971409 RepID=UPI003511F719
MTGHPIIDPTSDGRDSAAGGPTQARDVVAFGQEIGRVLSDGRIIGRAEPYAKVFPSSREVKRAVGVTAWAVLEDIALDAQLDDRGRLVAHTNVRRIADNLGLSKNAVTKHLGRLRVYGFVLHEEQRETRSGRYVASWYVLDPSACIERFTTTPTLEHDRENGLVSPCPTIGDTAAGDPCPTSWDTESDDPRPMSWDTGETATVSHVTGHREMGQCKDSAVAEEEHLQHAREADPAGVVDRLVEVGLDAAAAESLLAEHGQELVEAALAALPWDRVRNPAGWLVKAVRDGWAVEAQQRRQREVQPSPRVPDYEPPSVEPEGLAHEAWAAFAVTVLDDRSLAEAIAKVTTPVAGIGRRSVPVAVGELGGWAASAFAASCGGSLRDALTDALPDAEPVPFDRSLSFVEIPAVDVAPDWQTRLADAVKFADAQRDIAAEPQNPGRRRDAQLEVAR